MSARLTPVDPATTQGKSKELLEVVNKSLRMTPNMMRTMAQSPAALEAYLAFSGALSHGVLPAPLREQLALTVAETNGCDYCAAAHSALGKMAGLKPEQISAARFGHATDPKSEAAMRLAMQIVEQRGAVSDSELAAARSAGLGEPEIAEVVAHVALNVFTNYFNRLAETEIDFPKVSATRNALSI